MAPHSAREQRPGRSSRALAATALAEPALATAALAATAEPSSNAADACRRASGAAHTWYRRRFLERARGHAYEYHDDYVYGRRCG